MADNRTEPATQKRRQEARKKGQVARSSDVVTAAVTIAGLATLAITAPAMLRRAAEIVRQGITRAGHPNAAEPHAVGALATWALESIGMTVAPIAIACAIAGVVANVVQNRPRLSAESIRPQSSRLSPRSGIKRIVGAQALFESTKTLVKTLIVAGAAGLALWPQLDRMRSLVGLPPAVALMLVSRIVLRMGVFTCAALVLIAIVDYIWQRRQHEKSLRMTKEEVRLEQRQADIAPEVRSAVRRRQFQMARRRMMSEVATADVVVTNPTHYAVALRYDGSRPAPQVVAKGVDLVATAIRRAAAEADVPVMANPPLARALHNEVELGQEIPEEFFHAVAEVLAFVYRAAGRRRRA